MGLTAAFYSLVDSALLRGLPFPGGERIVALSTRDAAGWPMPLADYEAIEENQQSLSWIAPLRTFNTMVTRGRWTRGMIGSYVTADLFGRFGVHPILGRGFDAEDELPTSPPVALISHRLWQGTYAGDPGVIGEQIVINREPTTVIGVLPAGFHFPIRHDVWGILRREGRIWSRSQVLAVGQLAPRVGLERARGDMDGSALSKSCRWRRRWRPACGSSVGSFRSSRFSAWRRFSSPPRGCTR